MVFRGTFIISGNPIKNKLVLISDYGEKGNVQIILEMSLDIVSSGQGIYSKVYCIYRRESFSQKGLETMMS